MSKEKQFSDALILDLPVCALAVSEVFVMRCLLLRFNTLRSIATADPHKLRKNQYYSPLWYSEFLAIMNKYSLLEYISED